MKPKNAFLLFTAAFIWGIAFVAQSSAASHVRPFTFNGLRCILGGLTLLPILLYSGKKKTQTLPSGECFSSDVNSSSSRFLTGLKGGIACGICLCLGSTLQQFGIEQTTVGKAGFITALYIVFVPVLNAVLFRKKIALPIILSVSLGLVGLFLLCMKDSFTISIGDFYVLLCSFAFTAHILVIDYFASKADGFFLSCVQFFTCGIISTPFIVFLERPTPSSVFAAGIPILYAGVLSCGVAYTLQIVGQKNMNPAISSLILSFESVFSALAGWILLGQTLSGRELLGCIFMFFGILIAQLPDRK